MTGRARERRVRTGVLVALAAMAAAVLGGWSGGSVTAHAELVGVEPASGSVVPTPPAVVVVTFTEPVTLVGDDTVVLDDVGNVVSGQPSVDEATVSIPLPGAVPNGTYTVAWSLISVDSHRISGATVFHVGEPSTAGGPAVPPGGDVAWALRAAATVMIGLGYVLALIAVGMWWFVAFVAPRSSATGADRWSRTTAAVALTAAVTVAAALPVRIARLGGSLATLRDGAVVRAALRGPLGWATLVTGVALALLGATVVARRTGAIGEATGRWIATALAVASLVGFTIEGHTRSTEPRWAMVGFDVVHLSAAAMWLGGIAALVLAFRGSDDIYTSFSGSRRRQNLVPLDHIDLARLVVRFSTAALGTVVVVVAAGVGMAVLLMSSPGDLTRTAFGLTLVVKIVLVAVAVALGALNRRRLVPALIDEPAERARRRLGRIVRVELLVLVAVVGVTAVLVGRSPRESEAAAETAPVGTSVDLVGADGRAVIDVQPAAAGSNEIRIRLYDVDGDPLEPIETPSVRLTEPNLGVGPLTPVVHPLGPGDYHVIVDIPLAGEWDLAVDVRVEEFSSASAALEVTIAE